MRILNSPECTMTCLTWNARARNHRARLICNFDRKRCKMATAVTPAEYEMIQGVKGFERQVNYTYARATCSHVRAD